MLRRRTTIIAGAAVAAVGAVIWLAQPAPAPLRGSAGLCVVQRLSRPLGATPFDPVHLAPTARQRWTAGEIERLWTHRDTSSGRTYRSPVIDMSRGGVFAVVATFPAARGRPALMLWSSGPTLTPEDFARNRRELRSPDGGRTLVLRADNLQPDERHLQHLFIHLPEATSLGSTLETLSVLDREDLTRHGLTGPLRLTEGGEVRDVVLANPGHRASYDIDATGSLVSFGVHLEAGTVATIRASQQTPSGDTAIATNRIDTPGWHDFTVPLVPHTGRSVLTFEAVTEPTGGVTWSTPLLLAADTPPERPHIILYVVDALRADALALYGATQNRAPVIDALGRQALLFTRAYAAASWTKPSVTTLLTSLYPMTHGVGARFYSDPLPSTAFTLQKALAAAGYLTGQFSANPFTGTLSNLDQGFDVTATPQSLRGVATPDAGDPIRAADIHQRVLAWLSRHSGARVFAYIQPVDTHPPFSITGATPREAYEASLASVDTEIGRFRDRLASLGLADNTLFVLTADHGESFGEHGREGHGQSVFDEEVRVPLLVHWPGRIAPTRVDEPVHHVDLAPTILAIAGIPDADSRFQGRSLWPGAPTQRPSPVVVTRFVYPEDADSSVADRTETHAIIDYPWKLMVFARPGAPVRAELYRLDSDQTERQDLAGSQVARVKTLQSALERFMADQAQRRLRFHADHASVSPPPGTLLRGDLLDQLRSLGYVR